MYAGALRFEGLVAGYGWMGQPRWSSALQRHLVPVVSHLRPAEVVWQRVERPYVGSDPINYLKYAREMRHFYQAHVREPMFLATTRAYLRLTGGRDMSVSFASATASTLAVLATCLLGAAAFSRLVGLAAGLALAIEIQVIETSLEGWRDDMFMLFLVVTAWRLVRLADWPSSSNGLLAGIAAAAACLTRITAITFIVPAFIWVIAAARREDRREVARAVGVACLAGAALIAPYLINCWRATGDPFHAINYHTRYYRSAEGLGLDESVTAADYALGKLTARPMWTVDTAAQGLLTVPFANKWWGFKPWHEWLSDLLRWGAIAGAILAMWLPRGRLLLVILLGSLIPYALTWPIGGGREWRFTLPAYPFYLVFACAAIWLAARGLRTVVRRPHGPFFTRHARRRMAATTALLSTAALAYVIFPWFVAREAIVSGGSVMITAGDRDLVFFGGGWSAPIRGNIVTVRVAREEWTNVRLPMASGIDHWLTIRMDPPELADPAFQPRVDVFVNRYRLGQLSLTRSPDRMGSYRLRVPGSIARTFSRLDFMASHLVPAAESGPPFASLTADRQVAFRLWYVRLETATAAE